MQKEEVLKKIAQYKDMPIFLGLADQGAMLQGGSIPGHWLFNEGDDIIEVKINSADGTYNFGSIHPNERPFVVTNVQCDTINYVKTYPTQDSESIHKCITTSMTPIGTSKTFDEVIKEIEGNSIRKVHSMRGNTTDKSVTVPGGPYGPFTGSMVSTEKGGITHPPVSNS